MWKSFLLGVVCLTVFGLCLKAQNTDRTSFENSLELNLVPLPFTNTLQIFYERQVKENKHFTIAPKYILPIDDLVKGYGLEVQYRFFLRDKADPDFDFPPISSVVYVGFFASYNHVRFDRRQEAYWSFGSSTAVYKQISAGCLLAYRKKISTRFYLDSFVEFGLGTLLESAADDYHNGWSNIQRYMQPIHEGMILRAGINFGIKY